MQPGNYGIEYVYFVYKTKNMRPFIFSFGALLVFIAMGCQHNANPDNANTSASQVSATDTTAPGIEGARWQLAALPGLDGSLPEIGQAVFLRLDSGRVTGFAGCNNMFGSYAIGSDTLRFNPIGSTKKFCNTGMELETELLRSLTMTNRFRADGQQLELLRDDSVMVQFIRSSEPE